MVGLRGKFGKIRGTEGGHIYHVGHHSGAWWGLTLSGSWQRRRSGRRVAFPISRKEIWFLEIKPCVKMKNFLQQSCRYVLDLPYVKISPDLVGWLRRNVRFPPSDLKACDADISGYGAWKVVIFIGMERYRRDLQLSRSMKRHTSKARIVMSGRLKARAEIEISTLDQVWGRVWGLYRHGGRWVGSTWGREHAKKSGIEFVLFNEKLWEFNWGRRRRKVK